MTDAAFFAQHADILARNAALVATGVSPGDASRAMLVTEIREFVRGWRVNHPRRRGALDACHLGAVPPAGQHAMTPRAEGAVSYAHKAPPSSPSGGRFLPTTTCGASQGGEPGFLITIVRMPTARLRADRSAVSTAGRATIA